MIQPFSQVIADLSEVVSEYAPNLNQHVLLSTCASQLKAAGVDCFAASQKIQCVAPGAGENSSAVGAIWGIYLQDEVYAAASCGWNEILASKIVSYEARLKERSRDWKLLGPSKPIDEGAEIRLLSSCLVSKFRGQASQKQEEMKKRMLVISEHYKISQSTVASMGPLTRPRL